MPTEARDTPPVPSHAPANERSVLVVDDEAIVARSIRRVLKSAGFEVVVAQSGAAAAELPR